MECSTLNERWNFVNCCKTVWKVSFEKASNMRIILKVTQGDQNCCYLIDHVSLLIIIIIVITTSLTCTVSELLQHVHLSKHDSLRPSEVLQFQKDSWNCKPCVLFDARLNKSYRWLMHVLFPDVWELESFRQQMWPSRSLSCWCHVIHHIWFSIRLPLQLCLYLVPFPRLLSVTFQNLNRLRDPEHIPF